MKYQTNSLLKEDTENTDYVLFLINKFDPIIKKYSRKLKYEEAKSDLIIFLIQLIKKLPNTTDERILTCYISKAIKNEFIRLNKKQELINQKEIPMEFDNFKYLPSNYVDTDLKMDIKAAMQSLSKKQKEVIQYRILLDYSNSKTAEILKISRQAVLKIEKKALKILKTKLKRDTS